MLCNSLNSTLLGTYEQIISSERNLADFFKKEKKTKTLVDGHKKFNRWPLHS